MEKAEREGRICKNNLQKGIQKESTQKGLYVTVQHLVVIDYFLNEVNEKEKCQ